MVAAFQRVVPVPYKAILKRHEGVFNRAEECATLRDFCDVDELEMLADSKYTVSPAFSSLGKL